MDLAMNIVDETGPRRVRSVLATTRILLLPRGRIRVVGVSFNFAQDRPPNPAWRGTTLFSVSMINRI